jgi:hypothetical protein
MGYNAWGGWSIVAVGGMVWGLVACRVGVGRIVFIFRGCADFTIRRVIVAVTQAEKYDKIFQGGVLCDNILPVSNQRCPMRD